MGSHKCVHDRQIIFDGWQSQALARRLGRKCSTKLAGAGGYVPLDQRFPGIGAVFMAKKPEESRQR